MGRVGKKDKEDGNEQRKKKTKKNGGRNKEGRGKVSYPLYHFQSSVSTSLGTFARIPWHITYFCNFFK